MKIFVSIASFQDPILRYTIDSIIENANYKKDLVLGIFDQSLEHLDVVKEYGKYGPEIRYKTCDPKDAKGACWARKKIQTELFEGEDIFMQIDSHTMFSKNWDTDLLEKYENCKQWFSKPLITGYPRGFDVIPGKPDFFNTKEKYVFRKSWPDEDQTHVMTMHQPFVDGYHSSQIAHAIAGTKYYKGFSLSAGLIFVEGKWVEDVPYDDRIYFSGEETTLALRSFTHGYDLVHVPNTPLYHWYNSDNQELKRELHWDMHESDVDLKTEKDNRIQKAKEIVDLVLQGKEKGQYGLGNKRTLKEYAELSGIDYENKTVQLDKSLFKYYEKDYGLTIEDDFE